MNTTTMNPKVLASIYGVAGIALVVVAYRIYYKSVIGSIALAVVAYLALYKAYTTWKSASLLTAPVVTGATTTPASTTPPSSGY